MTLVLNHAVGFDDGPFLPDHRGDIDLIGAVFAGDCLVGVLRSRVRRDGANATERIARVIEESRYLEQLHLVLLQGITVAGFNVVDIHALAQRLALPAIVIMRRHPDMSALREALLNKVPGGRRKWQLIEKAGPIREAAGVWLQCAGVSHEDAAKAVARLALHGRIPEPLRVAHLIAGGISTLRTRQRV